MHGPDCIFVAEFKMGTAEEAMAQIREHGYLDPYRCGGKRVFAVAVGFSETARNIETREVKEVT